MGSTILLIEIRVESQTPFALARDGGNIVIADRIDAPGDTNIPMLEPPEPQRLLHLLDELQIRRNTAPFDTKVDHTRNLLSLGR